MGAHEPERGMVKGTWICANCNQPLEVGKVRVQYLKNVFTMNLPKCSRCGMVMVTEEVALGKMAEAEEALEDK